jgi:hypothetical protein
MSTALRPQTTPRSRTRKSKTKTETATEPPSSSPPVQDKSRKTAALFLDPAFQAIISLESCHGTPPQTDTAALIDELNNLAQSVTLGDLARPEKITLTQATVLDVMFTKLSGLAMANFQSPHFESLMRLAFRAQSQCARTLETLATLKNPAVIAHQLNVAHQQYVAGSGTPTAGPPPRPAADATPASSTAPPPAQPVLPEPETIVRSAEKVLFPSARAHAALPSR